MKIFFKYILLLFTLIFFNSVYAQERTVTGTITTTGEGLPLNGVSVSVPGAKIGTTSGADGRFSIKLPRGSTQLEFNYVGYTTTRVAVGAGNNLKISMAADVRQLKDVVVVGYGSQKKSDITGAISSIKGSDLTQLSTQRVDQALQGRAAGVMVLNTDGAPGGNTTIRVRGSNSINGGNNALIVIDGLQGGNLNSLNPNDIESIEVLKDASATAIYGAQGANGVVLITTKLGKKGKPVISYNYSYGISTLRKKLDVMNAADFAKTINANALTRTAGGAIPVPIFSDADIQKYEKNGGTDWQDVIYRAAPIQNHELSISGGTDNLKYLVSGGYLNQQGILVNSEYQRFSLRANLKTDINKWSAFSLSWAGSKEAGNSPPFGSADISFLGNSVNVAPRWAPTEPIYDSIGNYSVHRPGYGASDTWNPLASALEPKVDNNTIRNVLNSYIEFKPFEGLSLRITGGANIININNRMYHNLKTYEGKQNTGLGLSTESMNVRYQNSNILTYDKTFKDHHITFTGVAEQQYSKFNFSSLRASKFLVDQTGVNNLGGANIVVPTSDAEERVLNSYLGRINYAFADKYLLTASYRADGSSVFGKNNKWGYFPSASVAWKASEESFIRNLNVFSTLKIRGSWGITGNQAISPYQTLSRISSGSNYPYNGSDGTDLGFFIANAPNPSLKWESTTQTDVGIDLAVFKGRLTVSADYYKKTTKDLLMSRTIPGYTGFTSIIDNVGSIENRGIEIEIGGDPLVGKVRWTTGFNISANRNKVLNLGNIDRLGYRTTKGGYNVNDPFMYLIVGKSFGQIYGYSYEGTWKTSEAKQAADYGQLPGDRKFTDINKDGVINKEDLTVIGNAFPKFIFGWTNRVSYNNFELNFLIQGAKGNDIFNMGRIRMETPGEGTSSRLLNRWTPENQNTDVPAFIDGKTREEAGLTSKIAIGGDQRISRWVEDGSYVRLKNITVSYNLPKSITEKFRLSNLKAFVSGANLITLTKYTGYDPEVSSYNANDAQIGVDFSNYPQAKIVNFGLNVSF
ncbi:SusC/RagA family TonB-linked outer membrane protein [Segetibacter koreensis]|uniref:SusC/RagA family TonB-linked outer membrane protein n=1 Tax=Segetibacter koreensis TaxID=398037 RepID=UPI000381D752|nr:TonB-dependent receptor [Segetibacter koreensis]